MIEIREMTMSCEAKKHAFRQTQDGVVVSFVLHPQDVPSDLALAVLGTRYMLALVEIGDDEQPKEGSSNGRASVSKTENEGSNPSPSARSWHDMMPAQQAGILCNEKSFETFLREQHAQAFHKSDYDPAGCIRIICGVTSRSHIVPGTAAAGAWRIIARDYRAWMREPEIVG